METFEIHITGDESILNNAERLGLRTIVVELLTPDVTVLRNEFMTSHVAKFVNYEACKIWVDDIVLQLKDAGTNIIRVKIESPYYEHYVEQSCYIESHFKTENPDKYPISRNVRKSYYLGTDRVYNQDCYSEFRKKWDEVELCLYDSDYLEDADWLDLWDNTPEQVVVLKKIVAVLENGPTSVDDTVWAKLTQELQSVTDPGLYGCQYCYARWDIMLHGNKILHRHRS